MRIENSYHVKTRRNMKILLQVLKLKYPYLKIWDRSMWSLLNEWCAHNLLYNLGIERNRTADVDLDDEDLLHRCCYAVLAGIYFIISKFYFKYNDNFIFQTA